jgi:hypothetical protein
MIDKLYIVKLISQKLGKDLNFDDDLTVPTCDAPDRVNAMNI